MRWHVSTTALARAAPGAMASSAGRCDHQLMTSSSRAVVAVEAVQGDVRDAVRRALAGAEWTRFVEKGADVSLKVNLGWDLFIPGSITSPLVLEALIEEIRDHVGRIYVVEADQVLEDIESAFHAS